ncbi:MAG: ECF transporter S component [Saccharofermentanales bacterium]
MRSRRGIERTIEWGTFAALIVLLVVCAVFEFEQSSLIILLAAILANVPFFVHYERSHPKAREILPIVVMAAIATAGRLIFGPLPSFKPVSAIVIVTALAFGRRSGYMCGALTALASNMFMGQGPWTPWQMVAWGMIGYVAGALRDHGALERPIAVYVYGFVSPLVYGVLLDSWHIIGFVRPITWTSAILAYGAGLPFNLTHAVATVLFLIPILGPWTRKLERVKRKFGLEADLVRHNGEHIV